MTLTSIASAVTIVDKRARQRRWRLEGGQISPPDGVFALQCTIVDLHEDGARVRVSQSLNMPDRIRLFDTRERIVYTADLIWSGPPEYGLRFIEKNAF